MTIWLWKIKIPYIFKGIEWISKLYLRHVFFIKALVTDEQFKEMSPNVTEIWISP